MMNRARDGARSLSLFAMAVGLSLLAGACSSGQAGPDVLAKVNGRKIMRPEVDKYYRNQTEGSPRRPRRNRPKACSSAFCAS